MSKRLNETIACFRNSRPGLDAMDAFLKKQAIHFEPGIRRNARHCLENGGNRMRAALVLTAGWRPDETAAPDIVRVAAIIEMIHLATLIHDDIMDEGKQRRNAPTAAVEFGAHQAVLLGDSFFAHALHLAAEFPDPAICRQVAGAARRVCAGEIMQSLPTNNRQPGIRRYYRVITLKTAELFRLACSLGAYTAGYPPDFADAAGRFGLKLGVAYQLYDDLLDYFGHSGRAGKTLARDFQGANITLPLIILLQRLNRSQQQRLRDELGSPDMSTFTKWRNQMKKSKVFPAVQAAITRQLKQADTALAAYRRLPPATILPEALKLLENRLQELAPPD